MNGRHGHTGHHVLDFRARLGLVKGLRDLRVAPTALRAADALDEPSGEHRPWQLRDGPADPRSLPHRARFDETKGSAPLMNTTSITPSIEVTIGRQTRLYYLYITTAPAALDAPATMTLCTATLADLAGLALDEIAFDTCRARTPTRLILVDTTERSYQRRRS